MMRYLLVGFLACPSFSFASEDHSHEAEENKSVGSDKGILEANSEHGFKLSPEALKNFDLKVQKLNQAGPWSVPLSALLYSGEEINLFRSRNGFFKRIDFKIIRKTSTDVVVHSDELLTGDEIVTSGLGFLRISELASVGGVTQGHSH